MIGRTGICTIAAVFAGLLISCAGAWAIERFPPPDFESGYEMPPTQVPDVRPAVWEYLDVAVLVAALGLAAWLVHHRRSRRGVFLLMVFSLAYFGFWRKGCVCPIGAIGNIAWAIGDPHYAVPAAAVLFFALPLIFALFYGRVFCAAVCPLGALQDLVVVRPVAVAPWLETGLRLAAYLYLAAAVLLAATGSMLLICQYDPFVAIFRLGGPINIFILAGALLIIGLFIGRPYCRFLCPYGLILRALSRLSRRQVTITPDECIQCRLCESACPFGAIERPTVEWSETDYGVDKRRLALMLLAAPVLVAALAWGGWSLAEPLSRTHRRVRLADELVLFETGRMAEVSDPIKAFRRTGETTEALYAQVRAIQNRFRWGGLLAGGFVGLVAAGNLIGLCIRWRRMDYTAHVGGCLACGRCFAYCPQHDVWKQRRASAKPVAGQSSQSGVQGGCMAPDAGRHTVEQTDQTDPAGPTGGPAS